MKLKHLFLASGSLLLLSGIWSACFTFGGWFNQPIAFTYKWHDTDLARLNRLVGFVPYYEDTVLPLVGVGLMAVGIFIVGCTLLIRLGNGHRPRSP
jgi:uncharacterized membrane protein SirB2